jgi:ent-copalyl diphosphate synthase
MFNCYSAAQTRYAGESLLESLETFSRSFLEEKLRSNDCVDKWLIPKDLAGEVAYALETPYVCSPPMVEAAVYMKHYGPEDIWIGKSFYRMPLVNNDTFLALAKTDFNACQAEAQRCLEEANRYSSNIL